MKHRELERWYRLRNIRKASQFLILVAIVLAISVYAYSLVRDSRTDDFDAASPDKKGSRIENFSYSSPGASPWELEASSAVISDALDKVALTNPKVVYHGGKGGKIYLSADSGHLDRKNDNVTAKGNVILRYRDMKFTTGKIRYSQEEHLAETSSPVSVEGGDLRLTGTGLTVSIDNEEITIERDVKAQLFNVRLVEPGRRLPM